MVQAMPPGQKRRTVLGVQRGVAHQIDVITVAAGVVEYSHWIHCGYKYDFQVVQAIGQGVIPLHALNQGI